MSNSANISNPFLEPDPPDAGGILTDEGDKGGRREAEEGAGIENCGRTGKGVGVGPEGTEKREMGVGNGVDRGGATTEIGGGGVPGTSGIFGGGGGGGVFGMLETGA